jgi:hypothetical protein
MEEEEDSETELAPYVPTKLSQRQKALTGEETAEDSLQVLHFKCAQTPPARSTLGKSRLQVVSFQPPREEAFLGWRSRRAALHTGTSSSIWWYL